MPHNLKILVGEKNEILRRKSTKVERVDKEIKKLISEMKATLEANQGVGLAAPQVGINKDLIIAQIDQKNLIAILNPEVLERSKEEEICEEGCLSLPGIWGNVARAKQIKLKFWDEKGNVKVLILKDLNARIVLHEMDHLEGILFTDKVISYQNSNIEI